MPSRLRPLDFLSRVHWLGTRERDMAKTLVALGAAVAIGAAAFTTSSTPAAAQRWVAPVVAGSVVAGGIVGAAAASSPCGYGYDYYRPRGLFGDFNTNNCGCGFRGYPAYSVPAQPYMQPDDEQDEQYEQPSYRRHAHSYGQPDDEQYEQPYVQRHYQRHMHPSMNPYYLRHAHPHMRLYDRRHAHPHMRIDHGRIDSRRTIHRTHHRTW